MTDPARLQSFEEFWPFYVAEHSKPLTRKFHFVGTSAAMICVGGGILLGRPSLFALAAVAGYGPAWVSHFFIEKNRPASFKYPAWSFAADMVMWAKIVEGTMDAEVERVMAAKAESSAPKASTVTTSTVTTTPDPAFDNPIGTA
jgi:hypothetical protein